MLNKELKEKFNLPIDYGALVVSEQAPEGKMEAVVPGGAAAKAGIKENDIILEIKNEKITQKNPVEAVLEKCQVGQRINLKILRNGQEISCQTILQERK